MQYFLSISTQYFPNAYYQSLSEIPQYLYLQQISVQVWLQLSIKTTYTMG